LGEVEAGGRCRRLLLGEVFDGICKDIMGNGLCGRFGGPDGEDGGPGEDPDGGEGEGGAEPDWHGSSSILDCWEAARGKFSLGEFDCEGLTGRHGADSFRSP